MAWPEITPTWSAVIVAFVTVIGAKLFDQFVLGKTLKVNESTQIRQDLREDVANLKTELNKVYAEMGGWREKYYKEVETANALRAENSMLQIEVKEMKEDLELVKQTALALEVKVDEKKSHQ